jgi:hypothetical protein
MHTNIAIFFNSFKYFTILAIENQVENDGKIVGDTICGSRNGKKI